MSPNDPDHVPAASRQPRRRKASMGAPATDALPAEPMIAMPTPAADDATTPVPPSIDEDGAWIQAESVEVHQGAVGRIDAVDVAIAQGLVGAAKGEHVSVELGALGAALADRVSMSQGFAGTLIAREARVEQSLVRTLIAQNVDVHRPSAVIIMFAQRVSGDVKVLLDWRGALAFGAAVGLLARLFGRGRRKG